MAWIDEANKHVNEPGAVFELDLSPTRQYSIDIIRPTNAAPIKGNVLKLPNVSNSIGGILRTLEFSKITVELDDTDNEFRTLIGPGGDGLKNKVARIKVPFINISYATHAKTIFIGKVYSATQLPNMRFRIVCEQNSKNLTNRYPEKTVELTDYPNVPAGISGTLILEPYGEITDFGGAGKGPWGTIMVDDTVGAEIHLVGRQTAAITVDRVYLDILDGNPPTLQTEGAGNDYQIATQVIDGHTHTEIRWEATAAVSPTILDVVTCDISFGTREVCEAWKHYLESFCGYVNADFDAVSYATAHAKGVSRNYIAKGAFKDQKELVSLRDDLCREFEVDIWWEPTDGLVHFNYFSSWVAPTVHYYDYKDILEGYAPNNDSTNIVNYQRVGYNYDFSSRVYRNYTTKQNAASIAKYGATFRGDFKGFYFVRDASVAGDLAARVVLLRKDPIALDEFPLPIKGMNVDLAGVIQITHFEGKGASGYEGSTFQVRKTVYDLDNFIARLQLLDYSNFIGGAFILGPATLLKFTLESTANKVKYGFVCDPVTEQYSDGSEAKRLYD